MKNVFLAMFLLFTVSMLACQKSSNVEPTKITATGEALVYAKPDKIAVNFGIETHNAELLAAKNKNTEIWKKAAAAIKQNGIPDKDVETDCLSIVPQYKNDSVKDGVAAYVVHNMFVVTLSDPGKVEPLISQMLGIGVNHLGGVEFQTTQFKQHRESARELAIKAAREKAEKMAANLGCAIGKPLAISENSNLSGSWHYSSWSGWGYGRFSNAMAQNYIQDTRSAGRENPESFALGKISIQAGVSVTFELK
jgi:uncharacterized protein YggE